MLPSVAPAVLAFVATSFRSLLKLSRFLLEEPVEPFDASIVSTCPPECSPPLPLHCKLPIHQDDGVKRRQQLLAPFRDATHQGAKVKVRVDERATEDDERLGVA